MRSITTLAAALIALQFCGCSTMNNTEKGALVGTGMGAVVGTAIGAATGNPRTGAAIGALGGAVAGGAIGNEEDEKENRYALAQASYERDAAQARLGLTDVVMLHQQGTTPNVIVNQIHSTGSTFALSTADIQYLTQQNVPGPVIEAMQNSRARPVVARERVIVREEPVYIGRPHCYPYYCRPHGPRFGFSYVQVR